MLYPRAGAQLLAAGLTGVLIGLGPAAADSSREPSARKDPPTGGGQAAADGKPRAAHYPPAVQVCLGCHTVDQARRTGADVAPPLWGVLGRRPAVKGIEVEHWTQRALDRWLANPRAMAPETRSQFPGYADPERREAVLRFLEGQR